MNPEERSERILRAKAEYETIAKNGNAVKYSDVFPCLSILTNEMRHGTVPCVP